MQKTENVIINKYVNGYVESQCAGILFQNNSTVSNVLLNNSFLLQPTQYIEFPANKDELDITRYNFTFSANDPGNKITIVQRKYQGDISKKKRYNNVIQPYYKSGFTESNCGEITFFNVGNNFVTINAGIILFDFEYFSFNVNEGELDITKYNFVFDKTLPARFNNLFVMKKIFS